MLKLLFQIVGRCRRIIVHNQGTEMDQSVSGWRVTQQQDFVFLNHVTYFPNKLFLMLKAVYFAFIIVELCNLELQAFVKRVSSDLEIAPKFAETKKYQIQSCHQTLKTP